jgi:hydroxyquinol 1,2-dioxygenase
MASTPDQGGGFKLIEHSPLCFAPHKMGHIGRHGRYTTPSRYDLNREEFFPPRRSLVQNLNPSNLTEAVTQSMQATADPRLKQVMNSLVTHLHDFAREVSLTEQEWFTAIEFLTRVGQNCDHKRQEFILLSDVLGLSSLVDMINHHKPPGCTESTPLGPFHVDDAPAVALNGDVAQGAQGIACHVSGTVRARSGEPIPGAELEVWQADAHGLYDVQYPELEHRQARAKLTANEQGLFAFRSVLAEPYPVPTDGPVGELLAATARHAWRPAHLHFVVQAPGFQRLVTHVFRRHDPYLEQDAVFAVRQSLVADWVEQTDGSYQVCFDFYLNEA